MKQPSHVAEAALTPRTQQTPVKSERRDPRSSPRGGPVIAVDDLRKTYDDREVLRGVSFEVAQGEIFALLGPNGAGKSTTIEILEGLRRRSAGAVTVLGIDPEVGGSSLRDRVGVVLQDVGIEDQLTTREALQVYGSTYDHPRDIDEVLDQVGLTTCADQRVRTLSGGQKRRVDLALGIIGDPDLLFLDEPTTGFDPAARRQSWDLISRLRENGSTILLTTHYMDEVERLADRVAVIVEGAIVAVGTPESLRASMGSARITFRLPKSHAFGDLPAVGAVSTNGHIEVVCAEPTAVLCSLTQWAVEQQIELEDLVVGRPSLEDAYLAATNGGTP